MKVVDLVTEYLEYLGVNVVFVVTGGAALHLIHSFARNKNFTILPMQHEQSGAMAADSYARVNGGIGVSVATSGPGATNLLTGVCCSYYDGIPTLLLTGQVDSDKLKTKSNSRQIGFQETNVVDIFKPITKYAKLISKPQEILFEFEKAIFESLSGRPGPVLLDICSDIQRTEINPSQLTRYFMGSKLNNDVLDLGVKSDQISKLIEMVKVAKRPLIIVGSGIKQSSQEIKMLEFIESLGIPYTTSWGMADLIHQDHELFAGLFGTYPGGSCNAAILETDLIMVFGARLDKKTIGNNSQSFAPNAKKIIIDIDSSEIEKFSLQGMYVDLPINSSLKLFFEKFFSEANQSIELSIQDWRLRIKQLKLEYPILKDSDVAQDIKVNPYYFMKLLSQSINKKTVVIPDCGSNLVWTMQGLLVTNNISQVISAWNHSPMGYALPASIGASFDQNSRDIICITGDGGLQMNIQELATVQRHHLPIKIFVMNNHGHGIIQQGQDQYFDKIHVATNFDGGLPDPDYSEIAKAYGIPSVTISSNKDLKLFLPNFLERSGPNLCVLDLKEGQQIHN